MIRPFVFYVILLGMLLHPMSIFADENITYIVNVTTITEPENPDEAPTKIRTPPHIIVCTITKNGITVPSISKDEIYLYDIYDLSGDCLASFGSEQDFISFIYSVSDTIEIRLHTNKCVLRGYLYL